MASEEKFCSLLNEVPVDVLGHRVDVPPEECRTCTLEEGIHVLLSLCRFSGMELKGDVLDFQDPYV